VPQSSAQVGKDEGNKEIGSYLQYVNIKRNANSQSVHLINGSTASEEYTSPVL
jgi:hypothetical protein